jgi:hypothetical protein
MKFRPVLLLFGAALLAAVPVCADGIHQLKTGEHGARILLFDGFDSHKVLDVSDSKALTNRDTFFSGSSDTDIHSGSLTDLSFYTGASSKSYEGKIWSQDHGKRGWYKHEGEGNQGPTQVPEPGSFWFSVFGLAAVGFLARGRAKWARSN